jgi:hypothetical protein
MSETLPSLTPRSAAAAAAARGLTGGGAAGSSGGTSPREATVFALSPLQRLEGTAHYRNSAAGGGTLTAGSLVPAGVLAASSSSGPATGSPRGAGPAYNLSPGISGLASGQQQQIPTPPKTVSPARQLMPLSTGGLSPTASTGGASSVSSGSLNKIKNDQAQSDVLKKLDALPRKGNFSFES